MSAAAYSTKAGIRSYRARLLAGMMLLVGALTGLGLFLAERRVAEEARLALLQDFQHGLATLHGIHDLREAALAARCQALVARPRIHAALEDNALDLLYPSAKDELREVLQPVDNDGEGIEHGLSARFYRFLDSRGAIITPTAGAEAGTLPPVEEKELAISSLNGKLEDGYLLCGTGPRATAIHEILALPITSTETGEVIAALVLGFKPVEFEEARADNEIKSGVWSNKRLHLPRLGQEEQIGLASHLSETLTKPHSGPNSFEIKIGGAPHLLFYKQLNPDSLYPPAYEVAVYPLAHAIARQKRIRSQVLMAGSALLVVGLAASHFMSRRFSAPVEELAVASEQNRAQRVVAEKALESTSAELQRSARFSADASHQLKTPVTVLRAGIEELLARDHFAPEVYDQLGALLHQTYRITGVVDDLLLLSRMDAGRLQIQFEPVNLSELLEEWMDDLSALPDELQVELKSNVASALVVSGEKRYIALIVQNLLENARKYNISGGEICVAAEQQGDLVKLTVENTGPAIPKESQEHIFERFHRGAVGENIPGHGLGLNLARELARLQGGDVRLIRSDGQCTEFEVQFRAAGILSS